MATSQSFIDDNNGLRILVVLFHEAATLADLYSIARK